MTMLVVIASQACFSVSQTGRQDRERFGRGHQRMNPHASTTNKEKLRTKPYTMIKHNKRLKRKCKRSFSEKQASVDLLPNLFGLLW